MASRADRVPRQEWGREPGSPSGSAGYPPSHSTCRMWCHRPARNRFPIRKRNCRPSRSPSRTSNCRRSHSQSRNQCNHPGRNRYPTPSRSHSCPRGRQNSCPSHNPTRSRSPSRHSQPASCGWACRYRSRLWRWIRRVIRMDHFRDQHGRRSRAEQTSGGQIPGVKRVELGTELGDRWHECPREAVSDNYRVMLSEIKVLSSQFRA